MWEEFWGEWVPRVTRGEPYAAAFVDMRMPPGWDGVDTVEIIWQSVPNLQIVICTASGPCTCHQVAAQTGYLSDGDLAGAATLPGAKTFLYRAFLSGVEARGQAKAIVAYTSSGTTAARVARKRPSLPILAITPNTDVSRRLCLLWGAHSVLAEDVTSYEEMVNHATTFGAEEEFARKGDLLVVVAGIPFAKAGTTNNLRVVSLP